MSSLPEQGVNVLVAVLHLLVGFLEGFYVDVHHGGYGLAVGRRPFRQTEAVGIARNLGLKYLELDYIDGNARAKGLYESLGFQEIARIPQAYCQPDGTFADAILMRKCL